MIKQITSRLLCLLLIVSVQVKIAQAQRTNKVQASTKLQRTNKVQASTKLQRTNKVQASTKLQRTNKVQDSTKLQRTNKVQDSTKLQRTNKVQDSTKLQRINKAQDSTKLQRTNKVQDSTKLQRTNKAQDSTKLQRTKKVQDSTKLQRITQLPPVAYSFKIKNRCLVLLDEQNQQVDELCPEASDGKRRDLKVDTVTYGKVQIINGKIYRIKSYLAPGVGVNIMTSFSDRIYDISKWETVAGKFVCRLHYKFKFFSDCVANKHSIKLSIGNNKIIWYTKNLHGDVLHGILPFSTLSKYYSKTNVDKVDNTGIYNVYCEHSNSDVRNVNWETCDDCEFWETSQ